MIYKFGDMLRREPFTTISGVFASKEGDEIIEKIFSDDEVLKELGREVVNDPDNLENLDPDKKFKGTDYALRAIFDKLDEYDLSLPDMLGAVLFLGANIQNIIAKAIILATTSEDNLDQALDFVKEKLEEKMKELNSKEDMDLTTESDSPRIEKIKNLLLNYINKQNED